MSSTWAPWLNINTGHSRIAALTINTSSTCVLEFCMRKHKFLHMTPQEVLVNLTIFMRLIFYYIAKVSRHWKFLCKFKHNLDFSQFSLNTPTAGLSVRTHQDKCLSSSTTLIKTMLNTFWHHMTNVHLSPIQQLVQHQNTIQHTTWKKKELWNGFKIKAWQFEVVYSCPQDINEPWGRTETHSCNNNSFTNEWMLLAGVDLL